MQQISLESYLLSPHHSLLCAIQSGTHPFSNDCQDINFLERQTPTESCLAILVFVVGTVGLGLCVGGSSDASDDSCHVLENEVSNDGGGSVEAIGAGGGVHGLPVDLHPTSISLLNPLVFAGG